VVFPKLMHPVLRRHRNSGFRDQHIHVQGLINVHIDVHVHVHVYVHVYLNVHILLIWTRTCAWSWTWTSNKATLSIAFKVSFWHDHPIALFLTCKTSDHHTMLDNLIMIVRLLLLEVCPATGKQQL
jgi:hypothetical protein